MRVRTTTDENIQLHNTSRTGIIGKTFGVSTTTVKDSIPQHQGVAVRPLVGKVIGGLKGGARRTALGEISNANQATTITTQKV